MPFRSPPICVLALLTQINCEYQHALLIVAYFHNSVVFVQSICEVKEKTITLES